MVGPTTSVWGRSAKPTGRWSNMPVDGCVSGCAPNTKSGPGVPGGFPEHALHQKFGLVRLTARTAAFRGRNREPFSESRMREMRLSGSMSGVWKRSMVRLLRHRQTKGPATARPHLNHRATPRLHTACSVTNDGCAIPVFPVKLVGFQELHAAFFNESRTRGTLWDRVQEIRVCARFRQMWDSTNLAPECARCR